jgi:hypothetical protein
MSDKLRDGLQWLANKQKAMQSAEVTINNGSSSIDAVLATIGHSETGVGDAAGGVQVRRAEKDFIVSAADLVFDGSDSPQEPVSGWTIDIEEAGVTNRYEVVPRNEGERCFRRDEYGIRLRIHTKFWKQV